MLKILHNEMNGTNRRCGASPQLSLHSTLRFCTLSSAMVVGLYCPLVQAISFSSMTVASDLGQPLRATVQVIGNDLTAQMGSCFTAHLKSAGGATVADPAITITPNGRGASLGLTTAERMIEPANSLVVANNCGTTVRREFALLLDPPTTDFAKPVATTSSGEHLPVPGPFSNVRPNVRSVRSDDRLRRFIIARQTSGLADRASLSTADYRVDSLRPFQSSQAPALRNALHLSPVGKEDIETIVMPPLRLALADRLELHTPAAKPATSPSSQLPQGVHSEQQTLQRDDSTQDQDEGSISGHLLVVVGGVLVVSLGIIALLRGRIKHAKQPARIWSWEEDEESTVRDREPSLPESAPSYGLSTASPVMDATSVVPESAAKPPLMLDPMVLGPIQRYGLLAAVPAALRPVATFIQAPPTLSPIAMPEKISQERHDDLNFPELPVAAIAFEEISDVMEEAEFWIALQDFKRAVEVLEPYANAEQPGSPMPWLYLFDLYREMDNKIQYDVLRERFHQIFNARVLSWEDQARSDTSVPERTIEDVPHVQSKITELWQSKDIVPYLESLLVDDRYGTRTGFNLSIFREIMFLINLASATQPDETEAGMTEWTIQA